MKINYSHFQFKIVSRRFIPKIWMKYKQLSKSKTKLSDEDKFWLKNVRETNKTHDYEVTVKHLPTDTKLAFTVTGKQVDRKDCIAKLLAEVKKNRISKRMIKSTVKNFDGAEYIITEGVFTQAGQINRLAGKLKTNDPYAKKVPKRSDKNYIGVELEFNTTPGISQADIAKALTKAGLAKYVDVTEDGSCGWEVRVLLPESNFQAELTSVMKIIKDLGHGANTKCGTHVHLDMRNRDYKTVYSNLFKAQKFLRKFITKNRKYNGFCKMNHEDTFDKQLVLGENSRYYGINVQSFRKHKTIEIRLHQGTLDPSELIPWINLLIKIANHKDPVEVKVNTLRQAKKVFDFDQLLSDNLEKRILSVFGRMLNLGA